MTGVTSRPRCYRDGDVRAREKLDISSCHDAFTSGTARSAAAANDQVVDRDLPAFRHGLESSDGTLADHRRAIHRPIEMRRFCLIPEAAGDCLAHMAVRDKLAIATLRGGHQGRRWEAAVVAIKASTSSRRIRPLVRPADTREVDDVVAGNSACDWDARSLPCGLSSTGALFPAGLPERLITSVSVMLPSS